MNTFKKFLFAIIASFLLFSGFVWMHHPVTPDETYCNTRFRYCIKYPEAVFEEVEYAANDDGITAHSEDGTKSLIVAGFLNSLGSSVNEEYDMSLKAIEYEAGKIVSKSTIMDENSFETTIQTASRFVYKKVINDGNHYLSLTLTAETEKELNALKKMVFFTNQL